MKLNAKIYRAISIPTDYFQEIVPTDATLKQFADEDLNKIFDRALRNEFGPFPAGFKVFWGTLSGIKTVVGIEVMSFNNSEVDATKSGIIHMADPASPTDIARIDGALISELGRMNISADFESIDWKIWWELVGN